MSRTAFDRYKSRFRCREIEVAGEKDFIRSLTAGELARAESLDVALRTPFLIGMASCEQDGSASFPMADGENDGDFAQRMREITSDLPLQTLADLSAEIGRIQRPPSMEKLVKNSGGTTT